MSVTEDPTSDAYASALSAAVRSREATVWTRLSSAVTVLTAVGDDSALPTDVAVSRATSESVCTKI